ncbi:MAG: sulfotransferase domain-containing protein [Pseudomonadota bacterium]
MLIRPAQRHYRNWNQDSARWEHFRPRAGDIIISTYPKCGTTWTQTIVSLLIFQDATPRPVLDIAPWFDQRGVEPLDALLGRLEAQRHRRFLKSHLPLDGLPLWSEIRYIHTARDGRDALLSFHHHELGLADAVLDASDRIGLADLALGRPYPRMPEDPAEGFHRWLTQGLAPDSDGLPYMSFFGFERSWWDERDRPNVLLLHYNDLKADLEREMRRIATFLEITVLEALWPQLVQAARFQTMRAQGDALMGKAAAGFKGGGSHFFNKGENGRWRGAFRDEDLDLYQEKLTDCLPPEAAAWLQNGRSVP